MIKRRRWTDSEVALLRERWTENTRAELAEMLNRTEIGVSQMAFKLNLHNGRRSNAIPREVIDYIESNAGLLSVRQMSEFTGKSINQIFSIAKNYGLDVRTRGRL